MSAHGLKANRLCSFQGCVRGEAWLRNV